MKIAVIGAGAMGGAIVQGLLKGNILKATDLTVADPCQQTLEKFTQKDVCVTNNNQVATKEADIVMVVVKPWLVEGVLEEIKEVMDYQRQMLIVIAAGVPSEQIKRWLTSSTPDTQHATPPLFLAIPNIAIAELASMTFLVPVNATTEQTNKIKGIFDEMGDTLITNETHLAAGTTLASCGIAYAMRYIRAASEGGVELGFKADEAKKIVMQTIKGAVELLQASGMHPEQAIDLVTTPKGVTIKGLNEMEHAGFSSAIIRGLKAGAKGN